MTGLVLLTVTFGSAAMRAFESRVNPDLDSFGDAFWHIVYLLFAGEPLSEPHSLGAKFVTVFIMFTGTASAFLVERLQLKEGRIVDWE